MKKIIDGADVEDKKEKTKEKESPLTKEEDIAKEMKKILDDADEDEKKKSEPNKKEAPK